MASAISIAFMMLLRPMRSLTPLSVEQLQQLAKTITVKISAKELLGSGTLLQRKGQIYTVITNAHVLRAAQPPYQIQTPDVRIYQTSLLQVAEFQQDDLAVLQFRSGDIVYTVANIKDASSLQVGDDVFVGGFTSNMTAQKLSSQVEKIFNNRFVFTSGKVTLLLDKTLEQGYQIGYTNDVLKGMSGAPLLNILRIFCRLCCIRNKVSFAVPHGSNFHNLEFTLFILTIIN